MYFEIGQKKFVIASKTQIDTDIYFCVLCVCL